MQSLYLWSVYLLFECLSQRAESLMSQRRSVPLLLLYTNRWQWCGWNSAAVITSVRSSILAGLMSTMSEKGEEVKESIWYTVLKAMFFCFSRSQAIAWLQKIWNIVRESNSQFLWCFNFSFALKLQSPFIVTAQTIKYIHTYKITPFGFHGKRTTFGFGINVDCIFTFRDHTMPGLNLQLL